MDDFWVLLKVGDAVELLPEYQDPGDSEFAWVVVEPEDWSASTTLAARRQLSWPVEAGCETGCSVG